LSKQRWRSLLEHQNKDSKMILNSAFKNCISTSDKTCEMQKFWFWIFKQHRISKFHWRHYIFSKIIETFLTWAATFWLVSSLQRYYFLHSPDPTYKCNSVCTIKSSTIRSILSDLYFRLRPGLPKFSYMHIIPLQ
jgi:hypothetical protein